MFLQCVTVGSVTEFWKNLLPPFSWSKQAGKKCSAYIDRLFLRQMTVTKPTAIQSTNSQSKFHINSEDLKSVKKNTIHLWNHQSVSSPDTISSSPLCPHITISLVGCVHLFLGTFKEVTKVSISFIMSVCSSTCIRLAPTGQFFMKFDIGDFY